MNKNFTPLGHRISACLLFSLITLSGFSKTLQNSHLSSTRLAFVDPSNAYTSFDLKAINNKSVNINWSKESITSECLFEVERSFNNNEFKTVAIVLGPESDFVNDGSFNFKDKSKELSGKKEAWYRIKEVDQNGFITYSVVKKVSFNLSAPEISLFPNPFVEKLSIRFNNNLDGKAQVRILNLDGVMISSKKINTVKGINTIEFGDLSTVSNGIYIVEITMNGIVTDRQKVIKK